MQDAERILTAAGYERLKTELDYLRTVRLHEVAERLKATREIGAWDSPDQAAAREEQAFIAGRIASLEKLLAGASVAEAPTDSAFPEVRVGTTVIVRDENGEQDRYSIVGAMEAEPSKGRISNESPVGRALIGHRIGDTVEVDAPGGVLRLSIVTIVPSGAGQDIASPDELKSSESEAVAAA